MESRIQLPLSEEEMDTIRLMRSSKKWEDYFKNMEFGGDLDPMLVKAVREGFQKRMGNSLKPTYEKITQYIDDKGNLITWRAWDTTGLNPLE